MDLNEAQEILNKNGYLLKEDAFRNNTDMNDIYAIIEAHGWSPELVAKNIIKHYNEELPKIEKFLDDWQDRLESMANEINDSSSPRNKVKFEYDRFTNGINLTIFKHDKIEDEISFTVNGDKIVVNDNGEQIDYDIDNDKLYHDTLEHLFARYYGDDDEA